MPVAMETNDQKVELIRYNLLASSDARNLHPVTSWIYTLKCCFCASAERQFKNCCSIPCLFKKPQRLPFMHMRRLKF